MFMAKIIVKITGQKIKITLQLLLKLKLSKEKVYLSNLSKCTYPKYTMHRLLSKTVWPCGPNLFAQSSQVLQRNKNSTKDLYNMCSGHLQTDH